MDTGKGLNLANACTITTLTLTKTCPINIGAAGATVTTLNLTDQYYDLSDYRNLNP